MLALDNEERTELFGLLLSAINLRTKAEPKVLAVWYKALLKLQGRAGGDKPWGGAIATLPPVRDDRC